MTNKALLMEFFPPVAVGVIWSAYLFSHFGPATPLLVISIGASGYLLGAAQVRRELHTAISVLTSRLVAAHKQLAESGSRHLYVVEKDGPGDAA